jgi:hypothetical protein
VAAAGDAVYDRRPGGLEIGAVLLLLFGGMAGLVASILGVITRNPGSGLI